MLLSVAGHLDQHLEVYMHEFAAAVLAGKERDMSRTSVPTLPFGTLSI